MIYIDSKGKRINNLNDWKIQVFQTSKKKKHWKVGRSAHSLADFMMNSNGEAIIKEIVSELINENVRFDIAIPELEIRFDQYGHGREHDIGIWGITDSQKKVFVGVESKVDESFNEKISDAFILAKTKEINGEKTNAPERIEELLKRNFKVLKPEYFDLRYQLLYSTVGTLDAINNNEKADISILMIIVFKTNFYNEVDGTKNYRDYIKFINCVDSEKVNNKFGIDIHKLKIDNRLLYSIYMNIDKK